MQQLLDIAHTQTHILVYVCSLFMSAIVGHLFSLGNWSEMPAITDNNNGGLSILCMFEIMWNTQSYRVYPPNVLSPSSDAAACGGGGGRES